MSKLNSLKIKQKYTSICSISNQNWCDTPWYVVCFLPCLYYW